METAKVLTDRKSSQANGQSSNTQTAHRKITRSYSKVQCSSKSPDKGTSESKKPPITARFKKSSNAVYGAGEETVPARRSSVRQVSASTLIDVKRLLQESKEREERMRRRLEQFRESAKLAVTHNTGHNPNQSLELANHLAQYKQELTYFKASMDNILLVTKQTQSEVQKTKDIVASMDGSQARLGGSFQSRFVEDEEAEAFRGRAEAEQEAQRHSPLVTVNDEEAVSKLKRYLRICHNEWRCNGGSGGGKSYTCNEVESSL
eukprot:TRINITY_DN5087_c0_g1_i12.p1 TRINITY_DN5087_c0_g1~~TRINITY_DN5087_c0_g1_i12.p1  ORF type:complete len:262 (-),score=59.48 TRINITY_DN5087_c0_g1_i12:695-1480(-)